MISLLISCLLKKEDVIPFQQYLVTVTCKDIYDPSKDFYYYGYIERITDKEIKLRLQRKDGFKIIPLKDIRQIKRRNKGGF